MTERFQSRAFLGFGGNIGEPLNHFLRARKQLETHPRVQLKNSSPLYRTPAIGGPADQPDFLNAVVEIATSLSAQELLTCCQQLEQDAGRIRTVHWGPRPLDIDLLFIDDLVCNSQYLTLPHPRLAQRHFVLLPLNDLAPHFPHPTLKMSIRQLLDGLPPARGIIRLNETW